MAAVNSSSPLVPHATGMPISRYPVLNHLSARLCLPTLFSIPGTIFPDTHLPFHQERLTVISTVAYEALATRLKSILISLESSRGELGIATYQPIDDKHLLDMAEGIINSFESPIKPQPTRAYTLVRHREECRVYVDTHTDSVAGGYKQCSPALLFVIKHIHNEYVLSGKWVAKITSKSKTALAYMFWEASVYNKLSKIEGFPRLLDFFSVRGESNTRFNEFAADIASLEDAFAFKHIYEANKINQFIFYMDYHAENLCNAASRVNSDFTLSSIRSLYQRVVALHEAKLVHLDIKLDNIFIEGVGRYAVFKLFDFNLAAPAGAFSTIKPGTISYHPPELWPTFSEVNGLQYKKIEQADPKIDVWCMALVLLYMKFKAKAFLPWTKLLNTLKKISEFQQKLTEAKTERPSSTPSDKEIDERVAQSFSQLDKSLVAIQRHYSEWRIDGNTPNMNVLREQLKEVERQFTDLQQLLYQYANYFNKYTPQLLNIERQLINLLDHYRASLLQCATTKHSSSYNFVVSKALHPNPAERPSANEMLQLYHKTFSAE